MVALGAAVALTFYFQRAYGFVSRGWGHAPMGAVMAAIGGFLFAFQFVPAALYEQIFQQSLLGYSMACLALAMLPVGILRATLGRVPDAAPADGQAEPAGGNPGR